MFLLSAVTHMVTAPFSLSLPAETSHESILRLCLRCFIYNNSLKLSSAIRISKTRRVNNLYTSKHLHEIIRLTPRLRGKKHQKELGKLVYYRYTGAMEFIHFGEFMRRFIQIDSSCYHFSWI